MDAENDLVSFEARKHASERKTKELFTLPLESIWGFAGPLYAAGGLLVACILAVGFFYSSPMLGVLSIVVILIAIYICYKVILGSEIQRQHGHVLANRVVFQGTGISFRMKSGIEQLELDYLVSAIQEVRLQRRPVPYLVFQVDQLHSYLFYTKDHELAALLATLTKRDVRVVE
ncbi:MAG: hypothetical protein SFY70_09315 [Bacteroidia bacterium]|nr:hypothetical protein [Bacteroidia bacterium]